MSEYDSDNQGKCRKVSLGKCEVTLCVIVDHNGQWALNTLFFLSPMGP